MAATCSTVTVQPAIAWSDDSEVMLSFKFWTYSLELLGRRKEVELPESTEVAFQLFNFFPVRVPPRQFQRDTTSHSKYIVRGGKVCLFKSSVANIQKLIATSFLKVILYHSRDTSFAAGKTSTKNSLTPFLSNGMYVKDQITVTLFDNSKCPFAYLHLKLCLKAVGCHANERAHTQQLQATAVGFAPLCNKCGTVLLQSCKDKKTSGLMSNKPQSLAVSSSSVHSRREVHHGSSIVWPNGYVEDAGPCLQHTTRNAEPPYPLPFTGLGTDSVTGCYSEHCSLLEALCNEIALIQKSQGDSKNAEATACKDAKMAQDKCLQTDPLEPKLLESKEASRKEKITSIRSFTRSCCVPSQERMSILSISPNPHQSLHEGSAIGSRSPRNPVKLSKPTRRGYLSASKSPSKGDGSVHPSQSPGKAALKLDAKPRTLELEVANTLSVGASVQPSEQEQIFNAQSNHFPPPETEISAKVKRLHAEVVNISPLPDDGKTELLGQQPICDTPKTAAESESDVQTCVAITDYFPPTSEVVSSSQQQQCLAAQASESSISDRVLSETAHSLISSDQVKMAEEPIKQEQPVLVPSADSLEPIATKHEDNPDNEDVDEQPVLVPSADSLEPTEHEDNPDNEDVDEQPVLVPSADSLEPTKHEDNPDNEDVDEYESDFEDFNDNFEDDSLVVSASST